MNWSRISPSPSISQICQSNFTHSSYKIGDSFMHVPLSEAQDLLASATTELETEVSTLEEELGTLREELTGLKAHLYARFGRGINLEA